MKMKGLVLTLAATAILANAGTMVWVQPVEAKCSGLCRIGHDIDKARRQVLEAALEACKKNPSACMPKGG